MSPSNDSRVPAQRARGAIAKLEDGRGIQRWVRGAQFAPCHEALVTASAGALNMQND